MIPKRCENVMWKNLKGHMYTDKIFLWWDIILLHIRVLLARYNKDICNFKDVDEKRLKKPKYLWKSK